MDVPRHLVRYPASAAMAALSQRFGLPNLPDMQDWEHQVADPGRLDEFLEAYEHGDLSEDERFVLMEIMIQSCEDLPSREGDARWKRVMRLLDENVDLHIASLYYWALPDDVARSEWFQVGNEIRRLLARHRAKFERQDVR